MTKDNTIDEMGRINPKDPQAELRKKIDIRVFEMLGITKALKKDSWDYKTHVDTALNEILALFQAHQQELLSGLLGELPKKYKHNHHHDIQTQDGKYKCLNCRKTPDEIAGNDNMGNCPHFRSYNKALSNVVSVIERKIGKLNG